MITLDESTLIAYVDGELDLETARLIEAKLATDDEARKFVEQLREISALARVAFNDTLHEPVPQDLKDAILGQAAQLNAQNHENVVAFAPKSPSEWRRATPLAAMAAAVCLVLGLGGGYQYSTSTQQNNMKLAAMTLQQDDMSMSGALNQALEVNMSGDTATWANPDSGRSATFTPVRTYQDKTGRYCREYRKDVITGNQAETSFGLACRDDQGTWKTRYLILEDSTGEAL